MGGGRGHHYRPSLSATHCPPSSFIGLVCCHLLFLFAAICCCCCLLPFTAIVCHHLPSLFTTVHCCCLLLSGIVVCCHLCVVHAVLSIIFIGALAVVGVVVIVSISISPCKQWLTGRAVVLCCPCPHSNDNV